MGYITDGSAEMMGKATMRLWNNTGAADIAELRLMLEGAANVAYQPLQDRIINYSTNGPEQLRTLAAAAVSDPSAVTLPGVQEKVEPLVDQIHRGAQDYDRGPDSRAARTAALCAGEMGCAIDLRNSASSSIGS